MCCWLVALCLIKGTQDVQQHSVEDDLRQGWEVNLHSSRFHSVTVDMLRPNDNFPFDQENRIDFRQADGHHHHRMQYSPSLVGQQQRFFHKLANLVGQLVVQRVPETAMAKGPVEPFVCTAFPVSPTILISSWHCVMPNRDGVFPQLWFSTAPSLPFSDGGQLDTTTFQQVGIPQYAHLLSVGSLLSTQWPPGESATPVSRSSQTAPSNTGWAFRDRSAQH